MITKDGRDTPIEKLTPENYIVPKGEEKSYHCVIEVVQFDQKTGKRISKPRVQKFGKKIFETSVLASLRKQGFTVIVLHDPNAWIKEQQEKTAEIAKAKEQAEKERFDAAVAAAVAEQMAKMNIAGQGAQNGTNDAPAKDNPGTDGEPADSDNAGQGEKGSRRGRPAKDNDNANGTNDAPAKE